MSGYSPCKQVRNIVECRAKIDVHDRCGEHSDPGGDHVIAQPDASKPERVIKQYERNHGLEPYQENNLEALPLHCPIDSFEFWVILKFAFNPISREIPCDKKSPGSS